MSAYAAAKRQRGYRERDLLAASLPASYAVALPRAKASSRPRLERQTARTGRSCRWRERYDFALWLGTRHGLWEPDGDFLSGARVEDGEDHCVLLDERRERYDLTQRSAAQRKSTQPIVLSGIMIPAKNGRS